jgi:hypothetical protein
MRTGIPLRGGLGDLLGDGRHHSGHGDLVPLDRIEDGAGVSGGGEDNLAAVEQGAHHSGAAEREVMPARKYCQVHGFPTDAAHP